MKTIKPLETPRQQGFTLIELSIVLVIIGLIVGGVLVGQDLIKAAQIRAQISQISTYDAAANTFRGKYNGLPGDLVTPVNYFPAITTMAGTQGLGDGNGMVESSAGSATKEDGETVAFWYELNQANENGDAIGTSAPATDISLTATPVIPPAKIGKGQVIVRGVNGLNYYELGSFAGSTTGTTPIVLTPILSPLDSLAIDGKLDDGIPSTGIVVAIGIAATNFSTPSTYTANGHNTAGLLAGDCEDTTTAPFIYATDSKLAANSAGCALSIRASF